MLLLSLMSTSWNVYLPSLHLCFTPEQQYILFCSFFSRKRCQIKRWLDFDNCPDCQNDGAFAKFGKGLWRKEEGDNIEGNRRKLNWGLIFFSISKYISKVLQLKNLELKILCKIPYMMSRETNMMESECEDLAKYVHHISWWASYGQ